MKAVVLGVAIVLGALLVGGSACAGTQVDVSVVFTPEERQVVKQYYTKDIMDQAWEAEGKSHGKKGLPPGLAKKGKLPPGLQKQLQRNGTLPPGLEKKLEPLPEPLHARLRPLPPEYERAVIGQDVVILDRNTQKILDIIRDVAILTRDITR